MATKAEPTRIDVNEADTIVVREAPDGSCRVAFFLGGKAGGGLTVDAEKRAELAAALLPAGTVAVDADLLRSIAFGMPDGLPARITREDGNQVVWYGVRAGDILRLRAALGDPSGARDGEAREEASGGG